MYLSREVRVKEKKGDREWEREKKIHGEIDKERKKEWAKNYIN